eukprot:7380812-Prymnesium_polylepis.1
MSTLARPGCPPRPCVGPIPGSRSVKFQSAADIRPALTPRRPPKTSATGRAKLSCSSAIVASELLGCANEATAIL